MGLMPTPQLVGQHGHTDQTTGMQNHLIDGLGGRFGCGHHEVALIFAGLIVGHDDHSACGNIQNGRLDGVKGLGVVGMESHNYSASFQSFMSGAIVFQW